MKYRLTILCALLVVMAVSSAFASEGEKVDDQEAVNYLKIVAAVEPSLVTVEYTMQYDKGESPSGGASGFNHTFGGARAIREERPIELRGFLIEPTKVLLPDMMIHPRFVKSIAVRFGDNLVKAKPVGYALRQHALIPELDGPLKDAKPLGEFVPPDPEQDYYVFRPYQSSGRWTTRLYALNKTLVTTENGVQYRMATQGSLIVDKDGKPRAFASNYRVIVDEKGQLVESSPASWTIISADEMAQKLQAAEQTASKAIVRVALSFRSPTKKQDGFSRYRSYDEGEQKTERNVLGLLIWKTAYNQLRFSTATTLAWFLGVGLIGFTFFQLRFLRKVEFRRAETN